jgi:hypothetical protein
VLAAVPTLIALLTGGASALPANEASLRVGERLSVAVAQDLVTVEAHEVPLAEVLRAIGEQARITVFLEGDLARPVSISLAGVPVAEGLRLLLRDRASSVITRSAAGRLAEIRVRLRSDPGGAGEAATGATGTSQPRDARDELEVAPYDWHEDRLAFVRQAVRVPRPKALEELTTLLLEDEDAMIRGSAAAALGKLRSEEASEALSRMRQHRGVHPFGSRPQSASWLRPDHHGSRGCA